jgi:hypothetical protein
MKAVFIAKGKMKEQVFDGCNALFGKNLRDLRPNAFDKLYRGVELYHIGDANKGLARKRSAKKRVAEIRSANRRLAWIARPRSGTCLRHFLS